MPQWLRAVALNRARSIRVVERNAFGAVDVIDSPRTNLADRTSHIHNSRGARKYEQIAPTDHHQAYGQNAKKESLSMRFEIEKDCEE